MKRGSRSKAFDWLTAADKKMIFEDNAKKLFKLQGVEADGRRRITMAKRILFYVVDCGRRCWCQRLLGRRAQLQKITINYPTRSGASWPMFIAKEGGYYQKYGLDVDLLFGVHPTGVAMLTSGQAAMVESFARAGDAGRRREIRSLVMMGSSSNKGLFALMAQKEFKSPKELKGKRIAVGQIGDAPYNYTVALLGKFGLGPETCSGFRSAPT